MLNALTSFRFLAALMVFTVHAGQFKIYELGYVGVSFFYVLSGFILAYNYQSKFINITLGNVKSFYIARFAKIYPVHILTFILALPIVIIEVYHKNVGLDSYLIKAVLNLLLIQSYFPSPNIFFSFNGVSWSLSDEMFFYFLFPFLILLFLRLKICSTNIKTISSAIVIWSLLLVLVILRSYHDVKLDDWLLYIFPLFRVFDFSIGILIGLFFVSNSQKKIVQSKLYSTFMEMISLIILLFWIALSPHINQSLKFSAYYLPVWCLLVYIFAFQRGYISKLFVNRFFVFLGEISFSFYMIHQLVIRYIDYMPSIKHGFHSIISLTISLLLSTIIYLAYEEPLRKKIRYGFGFGLNTATKQLKSLS